jgi:hypothetical protein
MGLDPTARESNLRDSLKKYFVDNIYKTHGIALRMFDKNLGTPATQNKSIDQWVSISMGSKTRDIVSSLVLDIYCNTRKDAEGFKLSQLTDTVYQYLVDTTQTDRLRRIPFYQSKPKGTDWVLLGALIVTDIIESDDIEGEDKTKFKILTVSLRWPANV